MKTIAVVTSYQVTFHFTSVIIFTSRTSLIKYSMGKEASKPLSTKTKLSLIATFVGPTWGPSDGVWNIYVEYNITMIGRLYMYCCGHNYGVIEKKSFAITNMGVFSFPKHKISIMQLRQSKLRPLRLMQRLVITCIHIYKRIGWI